nr:DUF2207 domain-containing protein [Microlunatus panaciterrae]
MALPAHAEGTVSSFAVDSTLAADGALKVTQTISFSGAVPPKLSQKFETRENLIGDRQYVFELKDVTATANGKNLNPDIKVDDPFTTVTMNTQGANEIQMSYTVLGATVTTQTGTALRWRLLQGLSAPVSDFSATVAIPGLFRYIKCTAGPPNSTESCDFAAAGTHDNEQPTFRDGPRGEGEVVAVEIGFDPAVVAANETIDYRWTVGRAFSAKPLPLGIALGLLVLGGLGLLALHRRAGADARPQGEIHKAGEFVPVGEGQSEFRVVGDVRPGHVGTVVDERVDPIDITASLIDLAVRGHLLITELPRETEFARTDWLLTRQQGQDELRPFERALLDGIASDGASTRVSELPDKVGASIGDVQSDLYDEVVSQGWYERRPDATRNNWTQLALAALIIAVVVTGVLAAFTTFGLVGLALIALGLGLVFVAQEMPSRTVKGVALLAGLGALRSDLLSHPTDQMPPGREIRELSEVLPYAVVLGGAERWLSAIVSTDKDETPDSTDVFWYHGPDGWHLRDLPDSLRNFITTVSGSLFSR